MCNKKAPLRITGCDIELPRPHECSLLCRVKNGGQKIKSHTLSFMRPCPHVLITLETEDPDFSYLVINDISPPRRVIKLCAPGFLSFIMRYKRTVSPSLTLKHLTEMLVFYFCFCHCLFIIGPTQTQHYCSPSVLFAVHRVSHVWKMSVCTCCQPACHSGKSLLPKRALLPLKSIRVYLSSISGHCYPPACIPCFIMLNLFFIYSKSAQKLKCPQLLSLSSLLIPL